MAEDNGFYHRREYDSLEPADKLKIERSVYEKTTPDISQIAVLPLERLQELREESAAAERVIFERLQEAAGVWYEQAGQTLLYDNAIQYVRMPPVQHTSNEWVKDSESGNRQNISNMVYKMDYHVYENTRYDRQAEKSIPYAWDVTWNVRTNTPGHYHDKIAGQRNKRYTDKDEAEKYLAGRIKAYSHLFTEISPEIPPGYADTFRVNGQLLPGYTVEGEEPTQPTRAAAIENGGISISEKNIEQRKEQENMNEPLNIQLMTREMYDSEGAGAWLKLPATAEQFDNALARIGAQGAVQGTDYFINDSEPIIHSLDSHLIASTPIDELNYLAAVLENLDEKQIAKLNAINDVSPDRNNIMRLAEYAQNLDCYDHHADISNFTQLGEHTLNHSGLIQIPEKWAAAIDREKLGLIAATDEKGKFCEFGYIVPNGGEEWKPVTEIPQEYRITPKPEKQERGQEKKQTPPDIENDAIATRAPAVAVAAAAPFVLVSDNPRDKLKEITDKLENGIKGIFESEQYKSYLDTLSKFHNYSLNNCLLIAMQKPDATHVGGFNFWRDEMKRPVMKGEKGIKILAPSPFKTTKTIDAVDANGQPLYGKDGKREKVEQEITVPAFKVVSIFDVSQTDGEPLPQIGVNELTGSVDKFKDFFAALEKTSHVPIALEAIASGAKGYYHQEEKRIGIKQDMSELQTLKTTVHEIVHARIHDIDKNTPANEPRPDRNAREVQAEAVAYTVCKHYGLDTSDYSFGYVATWSGDKEMDVLRASLDTIRKEADAIITEIDKHFEEITQNKEQTAERQPGIEAWSEPATTENAPDNPGVPSDDINAYLPKQDTPEMQKAMQGLGEEVKKSLEWFMSEDMKNHGELRPATLEMIAVQGYELRDGQLAEAPPPNGTFTIYQLKDGDETRDIRFEPFDSLKQAPDMANYNNVYTAPLKHGDTLDKIYMDFNFEKPEDFKGHTLAMSDVVAINRDGKETAFYVDKAGGFKELPDFLTPRQQEQGREAEPKVTPFYQAYTALSNEYPDNIVFTKVGDFYEVMGDKAVTVANEPGLGFTVAGRDVGLPERVPLVGVPAHNFDAVLKELNNKNHTVIVADGVVVRRYAPAPPLDLKIVADYMQKQHDYAQGADPNSQAAVATVGIITRRLENASERIPDNYPQLKALITHAAQSPDLATLKDRMNTMHSEFIQHYSTAVQMTLDTSGKAEPTKPAAAPVKQGDTPPAPKAPAHGENVAAIEAKVKAGETINLMDLSDAMKKDKAAAQTAPTTGKTGTRTTPQGKATPKDEQPSIKQKIAAGKQELAANKSAPAKAAAQNKNAGLGE